MKNFTSIKTFVSLVFLGSVIAGCTIEPIRMGENRMVIKGAPDWVNKGSTLSGGSEGRIFIGVSSAPPQGDMALQKSIADDRSILEISSVLSSYLDVVSNDYLQSSRAAESAANDDNSWRQVDDNATRQIKDGVTKQIEDAISRQFKDNVSRQFKDEVARLIRDSSSRHIKDAISGQIDFSRQLEESIAKHIKEAVSRQVKNTIKFSMSNARIVRSWRDPKTYIIWSLSELEMKYVKASVGNAGDMNAELKLYFETNAESIFDRVLSDRNSMLPFSTR